MKRLAWEWRAHEWEASPIDKHAKPRGQETLSRLFLVLVIPYSTEACGHNVLAHALAYSLHGTLIGIEMDIKLF